MCLWDPATLQSKDNSSVNWRQDYIVWFPVCPSVFGRHYLHHSVLILVVAFTATFNEMQNHFHCATVSHSSVSRKSWDKHGFNEVASSIRAHTILKNYQGNMLRLPKEYPKKENILQELNILLHKYYNPSWAVSNIIKVMLCCGIELMTSMRSCLSQLLCGTELWLTVAQQKWLNMIPLSLEVTVNHIWHLKLIIIIPSSSLNAYLYPNKWTFQKVASISLVW